MRLMCKINTVVSSIRFFMCGQFYEPSSVIWILLFVVIVIPGCDTRNGVDRAAVKEEMANRELKRLRNSDIIQRGEEIGKRYFELTDTQQAQEFADSLQIEVKQLLTTSTEEEKQLMEAFVYATENNQGVEDYISDTPDAVLFYRPVQVQDSLIVTRLIISKKEIVRSL